jgi:hypothetical protein
LLGHSDGEEDTATEVETLLWTNYRPQFALFVKQNIFSMAFGGGFYFHPNEQRALAGDPVKEKAT